MAHGLGRRSWRAVALALAASLAIPSTGPVVAASAVTGPPIGACDPQAEGAVDQLPDVKVAALYGLTVRTTAAGGKRLRFGTRSWNVGDGPIEVRGESRSADAMAVVAQRIYDDLGGCRDVLQPLSTMWYAGDGHNHWHIADYMVTQLYLSAGGEALRIRKTGFCLLDAHRSTNPRPNTPPDRVYWNGACGASDSVAIAMGISVGYADDYPPLIAQQWIDVTGLAEDVYRLCTGVNPFGLWLERDGVTDNNYFWYDLRLNAATNSVTVLARGRGACLK